MLRPLHLCVPLLLGILPMAAHAEPWSVKLGYPPQARVLILEAHELGVTWEINEAAKKLLDDGHISSASAVATGPRFREVVDWARRHPDHNLGLSIALTNPYEVLSWRLMTSELGPTTLVNADGYPWQNVVQLVVNADAEDVRRELDAQLHAARSAGLNPTYLSGYYGTAFSRPDVAAVFLAAAQKYWIPVPVVELTPELIERFRSEGYPVDDAMIRLIGSYGMPKLDDIQVFPVGKTYEETRDNYCELLSLIPPGLTQIICRPAVPSLGMKHLTQDWEQRSWTAQALADPKVLEAMKAQQIIVTTWREVMRRFEGGTPRELDQLIKEETEVEQQLERTEGISSEQGTESR